MTEGVNVRELILDTLLLITRDGVYSHIAEKQTLDKYQYLEKQERSFFTRVCEGTLEHMIYLDYVLNQFSNVRTTKMKPVIRCILRSSVYELLFMDAVPPSATCNEAVKLAGKRGFHGLKGFVNGVLRSISRNEQGIRLPDREKEPKTWLSVKYSMPEWILDLWMKQYSPEELVEMLQAFQMPGATCVRVNTAKTTAEELVAELTEAGIHTEENPDVPDALYLREYDYLEDIPAFQAGKFYVQDASSMLVSLWAEPKPGDQVLDVCAAPGGKSIHMAQLLEGAGRVEARDLTEYKVSLIQENIERCGLSNLCARQADARILDESRMEREDIVIADLPCSGLGVIGRKPDIKYKATPAGCRELAALQREILHVAQQYVKPGGILMYSTCTINPAENEENVRWFVQEHPRFLVERQQQILPKPGKNDGFFLTRLKKQ